MANRALWTAWTALLALGLGGSCQRAPTLAGQQASDNPTGEVQANYSPLLALMSQAPMRVLHKGTRTYQTTWTDASGPQVLVYTEEVVADGLGNYTVKPLDVIEPQLAPAEETLFLLTQGVRQRMMFEVRDFGMRDVETFLSNYKLFDTGTPFVVAGVTGVRLRVEQRANATRRYVLDVDPSTGLILSTREELLDGTLVSKTEFTSLTYTPDLTNVSWSEPINSDLELEPGSPEATLELGFKPRMPKLIPAGWKMIGFAKLVDPLTQRVWARMTYTDGVELILFAVGKGEGPMHQTQPAGSGPPPGPPDRVRKMAIGSWTLLEAKLHAGDALVLGRAPESVLYDLIQSTFY